MCYQALVAGSEEFTKRLLTDAGIQSGMRVLDLGCGRGRSSKLLSEIVGAKGQVIGVDRDEEALAKARQQELGNATFVAADICELSDELGSFDAAFCRRVLMYLPSVEDALKGVARLLRSNGLLVCQENDASVGPTSGRPLPLHEKVRGWIWKAIRREGANLQMGFDLPSLLLDAGFTLENVRAEALLVTPDSQDGEMAAIVRAILPRIVEAEAASREEIEIDSLHERLLQERRDVATTYMGELVFGVWARKG